MTPPRGLYFEDYTDDLEMVSAGRTITETDTAHVCTPAGDGNHLARAAGQRLKHSHDAGLQTHASRATPDKADRGPVWQAALKKAADYALAAGYNARHAGGDDYAPESVAAAVASQVKLSRIRFAIHSLPSA